MFVIMCKKIISINWNTILPRKKTALQLDAYFIDIALVNLHIYYSYIIFYIYFSLGNKTKASKSTKGKAVKKSRMDEEEMDQEDLTAEMEDPTTENTISEVKVTPANVSRPDMQSQKVKS